MKKRVLGIVLLLVCMLLAACGKSASGGDGDKKQLVMGTSADYSPFEYIDTATSEDIIGFDVDLAKALGEKLGYEIVVKDMDFSGLITSLQSGKVDFVMAGMEPTPERSKNVDFTDSYFRSDILMVIAKDGDVQSFEAIKGKTVGVQIGSIQADKAKELQKEVDFQVETRDRVPDLVEELKSGRFDGVLMEEAVSKGYLKNNDSLKVISVPNNETIGASIAFQKDSKFTEEFNKELAVMKENGELDELVSKWFGGVE